MERINRDDVDPDKLTWAEDGSDIKRGGCSLVLIGAVGALAAAGAAIGSGELMNASAEPPAIETQITDQPTGQLDHRMIIEIDE